MPPTPHDPLPQGDPEAGAPTVCLTLDLESDYATDRFDAVSQVFRLTEFCDDIEVPLTVFVEGRILRDYDEVLTELPAGTEVQLHCNDHRHVPDTPEALIAAKDDFQRVVGRPPVGYRAANYRMTPELMDCLVREGFLWDASRCEAGPSAAARERCRRPFVLDNGLWEIPVGVTPTGGVPLTMSMLSLTGFRLFRRLLEGHGTQRDFVFVFHLHDLFPSRALWQASLKRMAGHAWNYRMLLRDPFQRFQRFVRYLKDRGFRFATCTQWLEDCRTERRNAA